MKLTVTSESQLLNARAPMNVIVDGIVTVVRDLQAPKPFSVICVHWDGNVNVVNPQPENEEVPMMKVFFGQFLIVVSFLQLVHRLVDVSLIPDVEYMIHDLKSIVVIFGHSLKISAEKEFTFDVIVTFSSKGHPLKQELAIAVIFDGNVIDLAPPTQARALSNVVLFLLNLSKIS